MKPLKIDVLKNWKVLKLAKHLQRLRDVHESPDHDTFDLYYDVSQKSALYKVSEDLSSLYKLTKSKYCELDDLHKHQEGVFKLTYSDKQREENTRDLYQYEYYCDVTKLNKDIIIHAIKESYDYSKDKLLKQKSTDDSEP